MSPGLPAGQIILCDNTVTLTDQGRLRRGAAGLAPFPQGFRFFKVVSLRTGDLIVPAQAWAAAGSSFFIPTA